MQNKTQSSSKNSTINYQQHIAPKWGHQRTIIMNTLSKSLLNVILSLSDTPSAEEVSKARQSAQYLFDNAPAETAAPEKAKRNVPHGGISEAVMQALQGIASPGIPATMVVERMVKAGLREGDDFSAKSVGPILAAKLKAGKLVQVHRGLYALAPEAPATVATVATVAESTDVDVDTDTDESAEG